MRRIGLAVLIITLVGIGVVAGYAIRTAQTTKLDEWQTVSGPVKNWGQMAAWIAAALFFGYKIFSGYFITNLTLKLDARRIQGGKQSSDDYLAITASLVGGNNGVIRIHDMQARVVHSKNSRFLPEPDRSRPVSEIAEMTQPRGKVGKLVGFERLSTDESKSPSRRTVIWGPPQAGLLNISTGDACQFAAWTEVPSGDPCTVEVIVVGGRFFGVKNSQWRASCVSLPGDYAIPAKKALTT